MTRTCLHRRTALTGSAGRTCLLAASVLALPWLVQPANAISLTYAAIPAVDASGNGSIDLRSVLGLGAGQTATYTTFAATFSFLAADRSVSTGTSSEFTGITYNALGTLDAGVVYNYNIFYTYQPIQSTAVVTSQGQSSSGASPVRFDQVFRYDILLDLGHDGVAEPYVHYIKDNYYDDFYHTDGPFSASLAYGSTQLAALSRSNLFSFNTALSDPSIRFIGVKIDANYTVDGPVAGVPEPSAWVMMLAGFFAIGAALRRRESGPGRASSLSIFNRQQGTA